jgi:hypothetical protein
VIPILVSAAALLIYILFCAMTWESRMNFWWDYTHPANEISLIRDPDLARVAQKWFELRVQARRDEQRLTDHQQYRKKRAQNRQVERRDWIRSFAEIGHGNWDATTAPKVVPASAGPQEPLAITEEMLLQWQAAGGYLNGAPNAVQEFKGLSFMGA